MCCVFCCTEDNVIGCLLIVEDSVICVVSFGVEDNVLGVVCCE